MKYKFSKSKQTKLILTLTIIVLVAIATIFSSPARQTTLENNKQAKIVASIDRGRDIRLYNKFQAVPDVPQGNFYYSGATSFVSLQREGISEEIAKVYPNFKLSYLDPLGFTPGSAAGIEMLLDKKVSFAKSDRPLTYSEVKAARDRGVALETIPIAIDGIAVFVNKSSAIKSLNIEQLQNIYLGKITNWKQLGGADLPIVPVTLDPKADSTLQLVFKDNFKPKAFWIIVRDYTSAVAKTADTPGAIGYGSSAIIRGQKTISPVTLAADTNSLAIPAILKDGQVNTQAFAEGIYPLTKRLYIVISSNKEQQEVGTAYVNLLLSNPGREIITKAGLVSLY